MKHPVTVVVPVYGDWPSLSDCIESLKTCVPKSVSVLLVNDCGPEVELMEKNIKAAISGADNMRYFRNPKNLGFVGTCNRAVTELDRTDNDILLLNSDTKVTTGFLEEMSAVLYDKSSHGAVSPRSNNATLCTVPLSAAPQKGIGPEASYALYVRLRPKLPRYYNSPVAHGFCMLIRRSLIKEYGLFDAVFGKGYGEEVDFCRRIKQHGYLTAICNQAYVFHLEARSFSLESKNKLLQQNNKIIWARYPEYRTEVSDYMSATTRLEDELQARLGLGGRSYVRKLKSLLGKSPAIRKVVSKLRNR